MNGLRELQNLDNARGCVLSIGNFDGVHRGHQAILTALQAHAQRLSIPSVVLTFEPHPAAFLNPAHQPPRLTTATQKAELIGDIGIDFVWEYPTDWTLLKLSPREFFDQIILEKLNATGLVEGPNFFFGKGRSGNGETLQGFCRESGRFLEIVQPAMAEGTIVSSSLVREAISTGDVRRASTLLGRDYALSGIVVSGAQRGRTIGFPTANLEKIETMIPANGVYAAIASLHGQEHPAAVSIGPNPTFGEERQKVEAHLLDVNADFYNQSMELRLVDRIRGLRKFESADELQAQINSDLALIRATLQNKF